MTLELGRWLWRESYLGRNSTLGSQLSHSSLSDCLPLISMPPNASIIQSEPYSTWEKDLNALASHVVPHLLFTDMVGGEALRLTNC